MVSFSQLLILYFPFMLFPIFLYRWRCNDASSARKRLPPSPRKLPIIGNLHQLGLLPHKSLRSLSRNYGPLMLLHFGRVPVLVASSADAAREIMKNQDSIFANRPKLIFADKLFYGSKDIAFCPYGEYWRQMRSICVIQLLSNKRVQSFRRVREEETSIMIEQIKKLGSSNSIVNLTDILILLANDIVCRAALGRKYSDGEQEMKFKKLLTEEGQLLGAPSVGDCIPWLAWINRVNGVYAKAEKLAKQMDEFLESVVEEHRTRTNNYEDKSDAAGLDFVDMLLEVQRETKDSSPLENDAIKAIILFFANRPKSSIADRLFYGSKDIAFSQYGEYWRQMRSICVLQLLSNKRVQSFRRVREEETSMMIEKIKKLGSSHSVVNLTDILILLTNDVLCRAALGRKYSAGEQGIKFKKLSLEAGELLGTPSIGDYVPWLAWIDRVHGVYAKAEKLAKEMDEFLESVVEEHRTRKNGEMAKNYEDKSDAAGLDFVDILLEVQRESEDSSPLENDAIKAIILDIFFAGTDTTHTVMMWTMAELLRHPRTMEKLQNEVREIAQEKEDITEDDLDKMPYLKAVIKESLRLHCPIPLLVPRESTQDTKIMGYDIAAGTQVFINAWAIARDPFLWENPEDFNPERFLNTGLDFKGLHFEFIPFGAGRRGCPGITFAVAVNELALAKLVHNFNFKLPKGEKEGDLDMTEGSGITIHKKYPLLVVTTPSSG